jgi:enoyl-CoA hydratase/carnithine racemase
MAAQAHIDYPADGVGMVLIDNPPRNFGSYELIGRMEEAVNTIRDAGAKVVVLASDNPNYFICHAYLNDIIGNSTGGEVTGDRGAWGRLGRELLNGPMLSIACNHAQAWGGGSELSWCCNLRVAGESATYGQIEVHLGIIAGGGGTTRLPRLIGETRAMEVLVTGKPFTARTAMEWGAINRVYPDATLRQETIKLAAEIAAIPNKAVQLSKRVLVSGMRVLPREAAEKEALANQDVWSDPEAIELLKAAQAKYDAGGDSWDAMNIPRGSFIGG